MVLTRVRVAMMNSNRMVPITKKPHRKTSSASACRTPSAKSSAAPATATIAGARKFRRRLFSEARPQAISGPIPMSRRSAKPSGTLTRLK